MREGVEVIKGNCEWLLGEWCLVNGEWAMVNGENSVILLLLNYYANSYCTISVISFQLYSVC